MNANRLEYLKVYSWAADQLGGYFSIENAVFSIIYSYQNRNLDCFISYKTFANWTGFSERTIIRAVKRLKERGVIEVYHCEEHNISTSTNLYSIDNRVIEEWITLWKKKHPKEVNPNSDEPF